jgi:hypothetical protein
MKRVQNTYLLVIPLGFTDIDASMCAFVDSHEGFEPHTRWTPLLRLASIKCDPKNLQRFWRDLSKSLQPFLRKGVEVRGWGVCVGDMHRASLWSRHDAPSNTLSTMVVAEDIIRIQRILSGRKFAAVTIVPSAPSIEFPAHRRLTAAAWDSIQEADARDECFGQHVANECVLIPERDDIVSEESL